MGNENINWKDLSVSEAANLICKKSARNRNNILNHLEEILTANQYSKIITKIIEIDSEAKKMKHMTVKQQEKAIAEALGLKNLSGKSLKRIIANKGEQGRRIIRDNF